MQENTDSPISMPVESSKDVLTDILRQGAQQMLATAIRVEAQAYVEAHIHQRDEQGHQWVALNGLGRKRMLQTGLGSIPVQAQRVHDRRVDEQGQRIKFTSQILPPYLRKTKSIEELLPWLYLKGISTGDFSEALSALLGPEAPGLSPTTIVRLKEVWQKEYEAWNRRSLAGKQYVYFWVDGIYFNIRLEEDRQCILVVMGATAEGKKELVAIQDGHRESEQSWLTLLRDIEARELEQGPLLAVGDGALGFWKALPQVYGACRVQRCWVHKTANVLDKIAQGQQAHAKEKLHNIYMAATKMEAQKGFDLFIETYQAKYPQAVACLQKDRDLLLTFYDFPAEHWMHIRTTNPIESTFATVRLRTDKTKGCGSRLACLTMVFKLVESAAKHWRALNGAALAGEVIRGVQFVDGLKKVAA
jgi:transposase-like protein